MKAGNVICILIGLVSTGYGIYFLSVYGEDGGGLIGSGMLYFWALPLLVIGIFALVLGIYTISKNNDQNK